MNPILYALIVAVFTTALSVPATLFVERRRVAAHNTQELAAKRAQARATRLLLHHENQHNLGRLGEYMRRVQQVPPLQGTHEAMEIEWRLRVIEHDLPAWRHEFWTQSTTHLGPALFELEIPKLFQLHDWLDRLTGLRAKLGITFSGDVRETAVQCRENPDLERVGSTPGNRNDPAYKGAEAFALKIREYNYQTQEIRVEWQGICNQLVPMLDLLSGDIPPDPPQPQTLADRLRSIPGHIAQRLPRVQVTWPEPGKEEPR